MIKKGDHGDHVQEVQAMLEFLGYELIRFGADGWYGDETDDALAAFALERALPKQDEVASESIVAALAREYDRAQVQIAQTQLLPECFVDRRNTTGKTKSRGMSRNLSAVTGITLHQTATCFLLDKDFDDESKVARALDRASRIAVHHTVLRNGMSVWSNPYENEMPHAQQVFNKHDVGIEIDGWYAGVDGVERTFWKPKSRPDRTPMDLTEETVKATIETMEYIIAHVAKGGGRIKYIHAHRQTNRSRTSDPGEQIWKRIAIPVMRKHNLGYGGADFYVPTFDNVVERGVWTPRGPGRPIPKEWDPTAVHSYYDRPDRPSVQQ